VTTMPVHFPAGKVRQNGAFFRFSRRHHPRSWIRPSAYENTTNVKLNRAGAAGGKATPRHCSGGLSRAFSCGLIKL
jgi:hypothetical protein